MESRFQGCSPGRPHDPDVPEVSCKCDARDAPATSYRKHVGGVAFAEPASKLACRMVVRDQHLAAGVNGADHLTPSGRERVVRKAPPGLTPVEGTRPNAVVNSRF